MSGCRMYSPQSMWELYVSLIQPLNLILSSAEMRGIRVDVKKAKELERVLVKKQIELEKRFFDEYGYVNYNSTQDCQRLLIHILELPPLKKTQKGAISIDSDVLEQYAGMGVDAAANILELRRVDKALNTFVRNYVLANVKDEIIHIKYNLMGTVTGRLSSSGISSSNAGKFNVQNLSNDMLLNDGTVISIRSMFVPRKGYVFCNTDASQSELRILAWFSNDPFLLSACANDIDLHTVTAEALFGVSAEKISLGRKQGDHASEEMRQTAKTVGFAYVYGASDKTINENLGGKYDKEELKRMRRNFFNKLKNVDEWKRLVYLSAIRNSNQFFSAYGRRRVLRDLLPPREVSTLESIDRNENKEAYKYLAAHYGALREGLNFMIQSSSVDFLNYGLVEVMKSDKVDKGKVFFLMQLHDSLTMEVETSYVDYFKGIFKELMEKPKLPIDVPMRFDVETRNSLQTPKGVEHAS